MPVFITVKPENEFRIISIRLWLQGKVVLWDKFIVSFGLFMRFSDYKKNITRLILLKTTLSGCCQTCYIVKFPEVHFNVIPLHDHAAVGVGGGHCHVDVLFKGEDVR